MLFFTALPAVQHPTDSNILQELGVTDRVILHPSRRDDKTEIFQIPEFISSS